MVTTTMPPFVLSDSGDVERSFPSGRHALLCFVKEDCPTCGLSMPLIEAAHRAFGSTVDVWAIGQDAEGNALLEERHNLTVPVLDDSALRVSYAYEIDTVPTVILADGAGNALRQFIGFGKDDWQDLLGQLAGLTGTAVPGINWKEYP